MLSKKSGEPKIRKKHAPISAISQPIAIDAVRIPFLALLCILSEAPLERRAKIIASEYIEKWDEIRKLKRLD